jgi:hypothetical protein
MALMETGRIFSLDMYKSWLREKYHSVSIPEWAHVCNGQTVFLENGCVHLVRGLDGLYYTSEFQWERVAYKATIVRKVIICDTTS